MVEVRGDLDLASAPALRTAAYALIQSGTRHLALDLRLCGFVDSFGLGTLVAILKRVRTHDGELAVIADEPRVRRVFELVELTATLGVVASLKQLPPTI